MKYLLILLTASLFYSKSYAEEYSKVYTLNLAELKFLTNNTFQLKVDSNQKVKFKGSWPKVCGDSAQLQSLHSQYGLSILIHVDQHCINIIKKTKAQLSRLPVSSLNDLDVPGIVHYYELVFLESSSRNLDLKLDQDNKSLAVNDNIDLESQAKTLFHDSDVSTMGNIRYRRCQPEDFGSHDPNLCNDRYGLDIYTDIIINKKLKIRGTTQIDLWKSNEQMSTYSRQASVLMELIYEFSIN